jgi:hypothetical protein
MHNSLHKISLLAITLVANVVYYESSRVIHSTPLAVALHKFSCAGCTKRRCQYNIQFIELHMIYAPGELMMYISMIRDIRRNCLLARVLCRYRV